MERTQQPGFLCFGRLDDLPTLFAVFEEVSPEYLRGRGGLKWTAVGEGVLAAWVAEMDYGLAPPIADALHDAVDRADTAYFYPEIERRCAEAAVSFWSDTYEWDVDPERVFSAPDVIEGTRRAIELLTDPGSPVLLHTPVYFPFFSMVDRAGRDLIEVPSPRDDNGRYRIDLDQVDRLFADGAGSIVFCNPWNPVGRSFSSPEIEDLLEVARHHKARVISDEIHGPLTYRGITHRVAASIDSATVVTVTSASKAWNLPGLKCAQVVLTNDADVEKWSDYYTADKVGVGTFGLIGNEAAYARGGAWFDGVMDRLHESRAALTELVAKHLPRVGYAAPEATYLAWLDFTDYELDDPAAYLLGSADVALTGGGPFGEGGRGHARLNFATTIPILSEIIGRIEGALDRR